MGTTLRYAYEVRNAKDYFDEIPEIKVPGEMLKLAEHILDTKKDDFDPAAFVDHYEEAVVKMLQKKQAGVAVPKASGAHGGAEERHQPDGRAAPQRRVRQDAEACRRDGRPPSPRRKRKKRIEGQREMLLPIAGKKKDAAKEVAKPAARRKAS